MTEQLLELAVAVTGPLILAVVVVLAVLAGWAALLAGGFLRELTQRRGQRAAIERAAALAAGGPEAAPDVLAALAGAPPGLGRRFARDLEAFGFGGADRVVHRLEVRVRGLLAQHTALTRLSPMMGLVATLLPLGPALARLSDGDLASLAADLTIAFTATVAGLAVSCTTFALGTARRSWYTDDLGELEGIVLRLVPETPGSVPDRSLVPVGGSGRGAGESREAQVRA